MRIKISMVQLKKLIVEADSETKISLSTIRDIENPTIKDMMNQMIGRRQAYEEILQAIDNNTVLIKISSQRIQPN